MKAITLTQGMVTFVDDEDYEELAQFKWHVCNGYASRYSRMIKGHRKRIHMHRLITLCPDNLEVDHIDRNRLNNQKSNLRVCDRSTNMLNKGPLRRKNPAEVTSGVVGVYWHKNSRVWQVIVSKKYFGCSKDLDCAIRLRKSLPDHLTTFLRL